MYNTSFECRYHRDDIFLETDNVNENQKNYIRDILYREDLICVFNIEMNDTMNVFEASIDELFERLKDSDELVSLMKQKAGMLLSDDPKKGLIILYSYDYMHATHPCVVEYLETNQISKKNLNILQTICK